MKSTILLFLFPLFSIDVYGADVKEPVSVMVGDSVTLHTDTNIQAADVTVWNFGQKSIAMIDEGSVTITASDKELGARLQLDSQTGDLKIINIKTKDSGDYKLDINRASRTEESVSMIFHVSVVPAVVPVDEVKSVSVLVRDSVTLQTDPTDIQRDAVILWRFEQQNSPVAEISKTVVIFNTSDVTDERFRGRLKVDDQTGSLTIGNIGTTDSGLYEVEIIRTSSRYTRHHTQSFNVTVSDDVESVSVMERDSVTLRTGLTGIQRIEQTLWKFGDDDLNGPVNNTDLNHKTGDLTIRNIKTDQSGHYRVEINTRTMILHKKYNITIIVTDAVKPVSVKEGETVTLPITEIQKDDLTQWMFEDTVLAEINKTDQRFFTSDGPDGRFRDRLKLDNHTGSLNITDTRTADSGLYEVKISSSRRTINRRFIVIVTAVPDPGWSSAAVAGICVGVGGVCFLLGAAVIYYCCKKSKTNEEYPTLNGAQDTGDALMKRLN